MPGPCHVCHRWAAGGLCQPCLSSFAPAARRCRQCALRLDSDAPRCGECLRDPPAFGHTVCLADYGFPWSGLLAAFKYHDQPELAAVFAGPLAETAHRQQIGPAELYVPVPMTPRRLAARGYNQAWELARRLARHTRATARPQALLRRFDAAPQAALDRAQRLANLRGAFTVPAREAAALHGRHVALVDDVATTGATARAAAAALLEAGAARVDLWVVARTASPDAA